jgi:TPR repeat protein
MKPNLYSFIAILVVSSLFLNGCKSTSDTTENPSFAAVQTFKKLVSEFKKSPNKVTHIVLWNSYLKSSQIQNTAEKHAAFLSLSEQLNNGEIACSDIDWDEVTFRNFWALKPHMQALACLEDGIEKETASYHQSAIELIVQGILTSGDGQNSYSAYEVATWGDAEDVIVLFDYEVVDSYFEFNYQRTTLYNIYVVNDPESGIQKNVYFENSRFLHQILELQYPFGGNNDALYQGVIKMMGESSEGIMVATGKVLAKEKLYPEAYEWLMRASSFGSSIARYEIGMLCLEPEVRLLDAENCSEFLIDSAELGIVKALVALAFMYREGLEFEQDLEGFEQLMEAASLSLESGESWFMLAQFYKKLTTNNELYDAYLEKSAALGFKDARFLVYRAAAVGLGSEKPEDIEQFLAPLLQLSEEEHALSQVAYARSIMQVDASDEANKQEARSWLERAARNHLPYAHYQLGRAFHFGLFGEKDLLKAYLAYSAAAIDHYGPAQLQVGYFNDIGQVVETNDSIALDWYLLCAKSFNPVCFNNLGIFYRRGIAIEVDYEKALVFFEAAVKLGYTGSISQIGLLYESGEGVEQSYLKALDFYQQSCENDHGEGCLYWANLLSKSETGFQDLETANRLFQKSCDLEYPAACNNLGVSFEEGRGTDQDFQKAYTLYKKSCDLGFARSCYNLGFLYENGTGINQDIDSAVIYFRYACANGVYASCAEFRRLD